MALTQACRAARSSEQSLPGVARRLVTFFCAAKRKSPKKRPPAEPPLPECPVLLEAAGGCGTRPRTKRARPSNSPRRIPRHFCVTRRFRTGETHVKPTTLRKPLVCPSPYGAPSNRAGSRGFAEDCSTVAQLSRTEEFRRRRKSARQRRRKAASRKEIGVGVR
jgi:hypothetical protein